MISSERATLLKRGCKKSPAQGRQSIATRQKIAGLVIFFSNPGVIKKAVGYNEGYYRTVAITDATGTELASVENGALFSIYKSFAWAGRAHDVFVDNIQFTNVK